MEVKEFMIMCVRILSLAVLLATTLATVSYSQEMTQDQLKFALARSRDSNVRCENDVALLWDLKNKRELEVAELKSQIEELKKQKEKVN
jgi:hypothetical protein